MATMITYFNWAVLGSLLLAAAAAGWHTQIPCDFGTSAAAHLAWQQCRCVDLNATVDMTCQGVDWSVLPPLPSTAERAALRDQAAASGERAAPGARLQNSSELDARSVAQLGKLTVVQSRLNYITQDSFKGHKLYVLDFTDNQIETVNVNAFRGLQNTLYQLTLDRNYFSAIPVEALMYLHQLHYLHMKHNRIAKIDSDTFAQTQLRNLRFLHLDNNAITTLPKESLSRLKLEYLTLGNNHISAIEPAALPASLQWLSLENNALRTVPFEALRTLTELALLNLAGNDLTRLAPAPGIEFEQRVDLDLSSNKIADLAAYALGNFRRLGTLDLSHNRIGFVPDTFLETVTYLEKLDLSHNHLATLNVASLAPVGSTLRNLDLSENELHILPPSLKTLSALETLNLRFNKLTFIDNDTCNGFKPSLKELRMGFNRLKDVPTAMLQDMAKLEILDFSYNKIDSLDKLAFGTFDGIGTNLIELNLAGNEISSLTEPGAFLYMSALAYLDLSHNVIAELAPDVLGRLAALERLDLSNNKLPSFPSNALRGLTRLRDIRLDDNSIIGLPGHSLFGFDTLQHLSLARNRLVSLVFGVFPPTMRHLQAIDLSQNRLQHVSANAFYRLERLVYVNLWGNRLPKMFSRAFHNLTNLYTLNLANNEIEMVEENALVLLPKLSQLLLSNNRLRSIRHGSLSGVPNLEHLDLSHNNFDQFSLDFIENGQTLQYLDLSHNKLRKLSLEKAQESLVALDLFNNDLRYFPKGIVTDMNNLRWLNASANGLTGIDSAALAGCTSLKVLRMSNNYFTNIASETFSHQVSTLSLLPTESTHPTQSRFELVDLSNNKLVALQPGAFGEDNVHRLDLSANALTATPFAALNSVRRSLTHLNLAHNLIVAIENAMSLNGIRPQAEHVSGLSSLSTLVLAHNQISSIDEAAFAPLTRLRYLDLSHNPVTSWHPQAFQEISRSIEYLNIAGTGLYSMPKIGQRSLRHFNLSYNHIYELKPSDLAGISKLETLDVSHNQFSQLQPAILTELYDLKHLNISGTNVERMTGAHVAALHKLQSLDMHDLAELEELVAPEHFGTMKHLRHFDIYNLPKININLRRMATSLPAVRSLSVQTDTRLLSGELAALDARFLRHLVIRGSALEKLDVAAFQMLKGYFVRLAVTNTKITYFPEAIFLTLNQVTMLELDVSRNVIRTINPFQHTTIPYINQHGTILYDINLMENWLICDCRMAWVPKFLDYWRKVLSPEVFNKRLSTWNSTLCKGPTLAVEQTPVWLVNYDAMGCTAGTSSRSQPSAFCRAPDIGTLLTATMAFYYLFCSAFVVR